MFDKWEAVELSFHLQHRALEIIEILRKMGEEGVCSALSENPASPGRDNDKAESLDCYSGCTSVVKI